jgi:pentatricopeptide repeat protein
MHCLATNGSSDEAYGLLESMEDGQPGISCYNAILLSHLRSRSWDDAIRLRDRMKASGITPDASTAQGLLLASYGIGGKDQTQICLEDLLDAEVQMGHETFQLASKILLPKKSNGGSSDVREALRDVADTVPHMRHVALDLIRSIRIAEVDQKRQPSKRQPTKMLHQKRNASWRQVMTYLIAYVKASKDHADA